MPEESTEMFTKPESAIKKPKGHESHFFGLSIRSLITLIVVSTASYMAIEQIEIKEPYYSLINMVVGYFFGQSVKMITDKTPIKVTQ